MRVNIVRFRSIYNDGGVRTRHTAHTLTVHLAVHPS
jgi:hypothetical protein